MILFCTPQDPDSPDYDAMDHCTYINTEYLNQGTERHDMISNYYGCDNEDYSYICEKDNNVALRNKK